MTPLDAGQLPPLRRRLLRWYASHARDLPWRRSSDPYRVWISEVMLQQTQVETVKPYFQRFLAAFPTVADLASAEEQQVLRLWEGLGYYRRARGLHAAAKQIVADYQGIFPSDVATLMKLPGIGRYTAGAIVSIAFGKPAPILEANTIRLLSRLLALRDNPTTSAAQRVLWETAEQLVSRSQPARFNQALMELGALVCTPSQPGCEACPLRPHCAAAEQGLQDQIPAAKRKLAFSPVREAAVVVRKATHILVRRCGPDERWAGLWDFPRFAIDAEGPLVVQQELVERVRLQTGVVIVPGALLTTIKHGVTRYRITLECYEGAYRSGRLAAKRDRPLRWVTSAELADLPLSSTGRRLARELR